MNRIFMRSSDLASNFFLRRLSGIDWGDGVILKGHPIVHVQNRAKIILGRNVTLNSRNFGYHANMHSPVKLMADRDDAVIKIGNNTRINGACLHAYKRIEIGSNCLIAANVQIIDSNGHEILFSNPAGRISTSSQGQPIFIEDNVWIGLNAIILPGVRIGQGAIIGANSVVSTDVPPMVVFAGNPGRVVKVANND
nr:acyltransferase [Pseudomonas sp. ALS1131]